MECRVSHITTNASGLDGWINESINGQPSFQNVTVTYKRSDGSDGTATTYMNSFITQYEFPSFDALSENIEALIEVTIKPAQLHSY